MEESKKAKEPLLSPEDTVKVKVFCVASVGTITELFVTPLPHRAFLDMLRSLYLVGNTTASKS